MSIYHHDPQGPKTIGPIVVENNETATKQDASASAAATASAATTTATLATATPACTIKEEADPNVAAKVLMAAAANAAATDGTKTTPKFKDLLEFPCIQHMRIIVLNENQEPGRLINEVNHIIPGSTDVDSVLDSRQSANGKYISYTLRVKFNDADEINRLYEQLPQRDFVKHVL